MIRTWCDNCGNEIRNEPDEVNKENPDWKPDSQGEIRMRVRANGRTEKDVSLDLCGRCCRGYLKVLMKPLDVE